MSISISAMESNKYISEISKDKIENIEGKIVLILDSKMRKFEFNEFKKDEYDQVKKVIYDKSEYFRQDHLKFKSIIDIMIMFYRESTDEDYEFFKFNAAKFSENFQNKIQYLEETVNKEDRSPCWDFFKSKEIIQEIKDSGYFHKLQAFYINAIASNIFIRKTDWQYLYNVFNINQLIHDNERSQELHKSYMIHKDIFLMIENIINLAKIIEKDPIIIRKIKTFIKDNLEEKVNEENIPYFYFLCGRSRRFVNYKESADDLYKIIESFYEIAQNYQRNKEKFDIMLKTYDNSLLTIDKIEVVRTGNMFLNYLNSKEFKISSEEKKEDINTLKELLKVCQFNLAKDTEGNINNISENLQQFVELIPKIKEIKEYQEYNETINTYRNSQIERSFELLN